jgi:hypothetical protein
MDDHPRTIRDLAMYHRVAAADLMAIAWQLGIQLESASTPLSDLELQQLTTCDRFVIVTGSKTTATNELGTPQPVPHCARPTLATASDSALPGRSDDDVKSVGAALLGALSGDRRRGDSAETFRSDPRASEPKSDRDRPGHPESRPQRRPRAKQSSRPTATLQDATRYFLGSRYLQGQYQTGQLVGPHAVQHLSMALSISVERAQRYLLAIDEAIAEELAAPSQRESDRVITPGFVAASGLVSLAGFALGLLSGYKGKYK